jgi:DNA-binding transcriptional ArsR family regulator
MNKFAALSDSTRAGIVELLGAGARTAGDIGAHFPISAPAISQHLKALREAGLVRVRVDGQRRIYSLDPAGFEEMEQWFARVRAFWGGRLDAPERALNDNEGEEK